MQKKDEVKLLEYEKKSKNNKKNKKNTLKNDIKLIFSEKNLLTFVAIFVITFVLSTFSLMINGGFNKPIKVEASANMVRAMQAKLYEMGYYDDAIDGVFDEPTKVALMSFQEDRSLKSEGEINDATLTALGVSSNEQTNSELYLLAKLIYSEARGEIYTGQVAVGAVVLNRVDDAGFPNTLQGVIYQPWAFTALYDGQFEMEPNATAYQAAQDAMNGWDPSYGSLYYYNPTTATSSWIFTRTTVVVIGNHVFAI